MNQSNKGEIMPDQFTSPPLRISNIVHGRRNNSGRVEYLLDSRGGENPKFEIPEQIVLKRWGARSHTKYKFGGMRLSPNIWRSIWLIVGEDYSEISSLSSEDINQRNRDCSAALKLKKYKSVNGGNVLKLFEGLGLSKFQSLMTRHNDPVRSDIYGTPDLFLWALCKASFKVQYIRFVEVKKPREPLSEDQKNELHYLNFDLNIKARVLRLREAKSGTIAE